MKRPVLIYCGVLLALLFLLVSPAWGGKDDTYTIHNEIGDSQVHDSQGGDHQQVTVDSTVDSDRGEHFEEHSSNDAWNDGSSHDHEDITTNGHQDSNNHWSDDGTTDRVVRDIDVSKDGSRREHTVETHTDKDGNTETVDTYTTYDSKGKQTFRSENHTKKKPPEISGSPSAEQQKAAKELQKQRVARAAARVGAYANTIK